MAGEPGNESRSKIKTIPWHPGGEAYVDGGLSAAAPRPVGLETITVSPISGPQGRLREDHSHMCPLPEGPSVPFVAPCLAGMRCYLSFQNLRAARGSLGLSRDLRREWHEAGRKDAARFLMRFLEDTSVPLES